MACGFEQGLRQAALGEMAELAGTEPRHITEFVVSGGGNAADDLGLIDGGDVGGPVAIGISDLIVGPPSTLSNLVSRTSVPISSRASRTAVSAGDSPISTAPPRTAQPSL